MIKENNRLYNSLQELLDQFPPAIGKTFRELDINHRLVGNGNKGVLGQIVEEGVFHYPINSDHNADFPNLNIELKTSGLLERRAGLSFKERVPLCAFNYEDTGCIPFEDSYVWKKCEHLLFALYNYLEGRPYGDMRLCAGYYHVFSLEDIEIIKKDYEILQFKIRNGLADTISESDTNYLSACTSGAGHGRLDVSASNTFGIPLKPRKFALKPSYMTQVIRNLENNENAEYITTSDELRNATFEEIIISRMERFIGATEAEFDDMIGKSYLSKDKFERYVAYMLGASGKVNNTDEFKKANITLKTIRLENDGTIIENMSFPAFSYLDVASEDWEDSSFKEMMTNQKFLFVVFENINGTYVFRKTKFWSVPDDILETYGRDAFERTKQILNDGNIVSGFKTLSNGKVIRLNNFPKLSENPIFHVRPHGQNSDDTYPLPVPDMLTGATEYTKMCFWINADYVEQIINED